ncbi:hypothetical protein [Desulfonatronum thioautotrophicum]|nr:hypothetical protein [Desulfonatronum thioautotrophicum]
MSENAVTTPPATQGTATQDHDSPWKEILELRFAEFLALLFWLKVEG